MAKDDTNEFMPDFFVIPRVVWIDPNISPLAARVYAVVYWLEQMRDGYCHASNATIAKIVGGTPTSVSRAIALLIENGYAVAEYDSNGLRTLLKTLVSYSVNPIPNGQGGVSQMDNVLKNKILKDNITSETRIEIERLYRGWLIEFVIGKDAWLVAGVETRATLLETAAKKTRLTEKRLTLIDRRMKSLGFEVCAKAIKNASTDPWNHGENPSHWKATIDWLFKSDEFTENWGNR